MLTRLTIEAGDKSAAPHWFISGPPTAQCSICHETLNVMLSGKTKAGLLFVPGIVQHGRRHLRPYREELKLAEVLAELGWEPAEAIELIFGRQA